MRIFWTLLFLNIAVVSFSQIEDEDYKSDRRKSFAQIQELKNGALVLRLTLHKKSADLYREAGNIKLADRMEKELRERNLLLALGFLDKSFNFCDVYIIEASDYGRVINGEKNGYFLNKFLKVDSSITLKHENIYFVEVGNVYDVVRKDDSFLKSEVTSTPILQNALVIKDRNMEQLMKPFPFNVALDGVTLDLSSFIVYNKGKAMADQAFNNMSEYSDYMRKKYDLSKKEAFVTQKIFTLNLRLYGFLETAMKVESKEKVE